LKIHATGHRNRLVFIAQSRRRKEKYHERQRIKQMLLRRYKIKNEVQK
jgi:hypothetical protein